MKIERRAFACAPMPQTEVIAMDVNQRSIASMWTLRSLAVVAVIAGLFGAGDGRAQTEPQNQPATETTEIDMLAVRQSQVADKYARLEQLLIRMAEIEATNQPQRAGLLKQAARQSAERLTRQQLEAIAKLLDPPAQFSRAIDQQQQVLKDMEALLQLLLSENRSDRLKSQRQRIREYIKEVERLIRQQRGVQGRTEGGDDMQRLADDQQRVAQRTGDLAEQIRENEEQQNGQPSGDQRAEDAQPKPKPQEGSEQGKPEGDRSSKPENGQQRSKPRSSQQGQQNQGSQKPQDSSQQNQSQPSGSQQQNQSQQNQSQQNQSQQNQSQQNQSQQNQSQQNQSQQNQSQQNQSQQNQQQENPARQRLDEARQRMRAAQEKLEQAQREGAVEEQEAARRELERAKAELEEILRQLREEEMERTLALLEGRFRRMLQMQLKVYESTKQLDAIPADKRGREVDVRASQLSFDESKIVVEADRALLLLREEGSSVAFPETVEQMRDDMQHIVDRLAATRVGSITQSYEEDVISALEEMIEALQKAQKDMQQRQQQQQQNQQQMNPEDMPLVDALSELKLIRSLQLRVNKRTERFSQLLRNPDDLVGQAETEELRESLKTLAERQDRIYETTRQIVVGKNR